MSTKFPLDLSIIDFSGLDLNSEKNSEGWKSVKSQVIKALKDDGCFKACSNEIPMELRNSILNDLKELFALPLETKMKNVSDLPNSGYIGKTPFTPLYESLGILDPLSLANAQSLTNALWPPQGKPTFSNNLHLYANKILEVEKIIRRMILEGLGIDKYLDEHMNSTASALRVMKYEAPNSIETKLGLTPHIDHGIIAILYQNQVDGFGFQTKTGEWINITFQPDQFLVILGETFVAWTNGHLHAPTHRVTMTGNEARYSFGTFSAFKPGYLIKAPEELVDEEHPLLYRPFDFIEVLNGTSAQLEENSDNAEKGFPTLIAHYGI